MPQPLNPTLTLTLTLIRRDHELEKYRKAAEAKIRKELALKGERKEAKDAKKKVNEALTVSLRRLSLSLCLNER